MVSKGGVDRQQMRTRQFFLFFYWWGASPHSKRKRNYLTDNPNNTFKLFSTSFSSLFICFSFRLVAFLLELLPFLERIPPWVEDGGWRFFGWRMEEGGRWAGDGVSPFWDGQKALTVRGRLENPAETMANSTQMHLTVALSRQRRRPRH